MAYGYKVIVENWEYDVNSVHDVPEQDYDPADEPDLNPKFPRHKQFTSARIPFGLQLFTTLLHIYPFILTLKHSLKIQIRN